MRGMFIKNLGKKGGIIWKIFTVEFKVIWQVIYVYIKRIGGQVPILQALQISLVPMEKFVHSVVLSDSAHASN